MKTIKVREIVSVSTSLLKSNPPSLHIIANGQNGDNNYTNIRLEPRVYITPPIDGIWEFDMVGDVPEIVDGIITKVTATYEWKKLPKNVKGIKVYGISNYQIKMLNNIKPVKSPVSADLQIIKAEAWVNSQPVQPTPGGTLIVNVDYNSNQHGFHSLQPSIPQGKSGKILMLDLTDSNELIFIFNPRHNSYSAGLQTVDQYTSIELMYRGKLVGVIDHIPVIS